MAGTKQVIRTALLSVADKTGILPLAQFLHTHQVQLLSTGGTAKLLQEHKIPVREVSDYTGFPEIMDGRVKTLHPKVHAGLLARPGLDDAVIASQQITLIDLLVVNLYPFAFVTANKNCDLNTAIENVDIGGPAMLRAAAKNYARVTVVSDHQDYNLLMEELEREQLATTLATRFAFAQKVFAHTAQYDACIANYLHSSKEFPKLYQVSYQKKQDLVYGENPQQKAALYIQQDPAPGCIATSTQLQGKPLSYNNIADADAALECVKQFAAEYACVIVKHANPCGAALASSQVAAYQRAYATDPSSAFGGIIAFNQPLEEETVAAIIAQQFVEVLLAPALTETASKLLKSKPNVRVLSCGLWAPNQGPRNLYCKQITGGLLLQEPDVDTVDVMHLHSQTPRPPSQQELQDLAFAWKIVKTVKSNAIVLAKSSATIGIGAGQMSRIDSSKIALSKAREAGLSLQGAVMASDAFFPFVDNVEIAAEAGITAIIQPGGSIRDAEVIAAAAAANISLLFTGVRHFLH